MRKLIAPDIFKALRIIRIANLDKEITDIMNSIESKRHKNDMRGVDTEGDENDVRGVGIKAVIACAMSIPDAETEIYDLIGGIAEHDDVSSMPLNEFFALLSDIAKENDLYGFFASALAINGQG